ncbi:MAG: hypothetical protein HXY24_15835, partial [Rubrivivax sp.]|nr:hypothetical protein [Rubrivivax sp.]
MEVAVGTDSGRVHLFGLAVNQPPLLTNPNLAETRTGYAYGVDVNDPDGDTVTATVEIWDPSAGIWLTGATQTFAQGQGRLNLEVSDPFDTWDSGQESRYRFRYDDGHNQGLLAEVPGPFSIPTLPWYLYYGQWAGLGALGLLVPALGWVIYRRQRSYRRSPVGRAESLLKQLRTQPGKALVYLHDLARDDPALLAHLPGLAREAGETNIANMSEGFQLILTRPEVVIEGLRAVVRQAGENAGVRSEALPEIQNLYGLCLEALEANTVSRIVTLRPHLATTEGVTTDISSNDFSRSLPSPQIQATIFQVLAELGRVAQTLHNYERVEMVEDKVAYLAQAIESLGHLDWEFHSSLPQPERNIFSRIVLNWLRVTTTALQDLQGRAQLEVSLKTRQLLKLDQATLSLELTNTGRSPASNISVGLIPKQAFVVSNGVARLDILPAGRSALVELPISAAASVEQFRAEFTITFDDREHNGKTVTFADRVHLLKPSTEFRP